MSTRILIAILLLAGTLATAAWYQTHESRAQILSGELQSMASLLQENQSIIKELQAFTEPNYGPQGFASAVQREVAAAK
jgi:hypothetical protein